MSNLWQFFESFYSWISISVVYITFYVFILIFFMQYPKHVALVPDGNRTWAREWWKTSLQWHLEWFQRCIELAIYIFDSTDIDVFTLWWLSTENLKNRTKVELSYLFDLYKRITENLYDMMRKNHVNFRVAGDKTQLPEHFILMNHVKNAAQNYKNLVKIATLYLSFLYLCIIK